MSLKCLKLYHTIKLDNSKADLKKNTRDLKF